MKVRTMLWIWQGCLWLSVVFFILDLAGVIDWQLYEIWALLFAGTGWLLVVMSLMLIRYEKVFENMRGVLKATEDYGGT